MDFCTKLPLKNFAVYDKIILLKVLLMKVGVVMDINDIKAKMTELYNKNVEIHVGVHSKRAKINVVSVPARITGIYKHLFMIETMENGMKKSYTVQYTDLFIGKVKIKELEKQSE